MKKYGITGVILAAGMSSRMKTPKALLDPRPAGFACTEKTFIEEIYRKMSVCADRVIAVLGHDKKKILSGAGLGSAEIVYNENYERGMFSSVKKGFSAAGGSAAVMLNPVDCPFVKMKTYEELARFYAENPGSICIVSHRGKRGHPVIFPKGIIDEIAAAPDDTEGGLGYFLSKYSREIDIFETSDKGVIISLNTQDEYRELVKR